MVDEDVKQEIETVAAEQLATRLIVGELLIALCKAGLDEPVRNALKYAESTARRATRKHPGNPTPIEAIRIVEDTAKIVLNEADLFKAMGGYDLAPLAEEHRALKDERAASGPLQ